MEPRHLDELQHRGFTVLRGLFDAATCRRARAAIDGVLGSHLAETVAPAAEAFGDNSGSSNFIHTVSHPHPSLAVIAGGMPQLLAAHAATLRSDLAHTLLNGQHYIRTDLNPQASSGGSGWHVDK